MFVVVVVLSPSCRLGRHWLQFCGPDHFVLSPSCRPDRHWLQPKQFATTLWSWLHCFVPILQVGRTLATALWWGRTVTPTWPEGGPGLELTLAATTLRASVSGCWHWKAIQKVCLIVKEEIVVFLDDTMSSLPSLHSAVSCFFVPTGSASRGGDVALYVFDINRPSLPTPFHSILVSVSVFVALSTVFHSINSPYNPPLSHSVLPVLFLPYWSFQLSLSPYKNLP